MEEYFQNPAVSQSQLKTLLISPKAFGEERKVELYFEEKEHFTIGSAVDCMLTEGEDAYKSKYHISKVENKPSDVVKSIINQVFDYASNTDEEIGLILDPMYRVLITTCCEHHNYQNNWKNETKVSKICEYYEYWEDLKLARGKTILSIEEETLIDTIVMSLRTNEVTSKYFNQEEIQYQVPIYFEFDGVECRALLDMVIFDRENKTIQPIDIKTMGDYTLKFPISLRRRRYDIQAAFYTEALQWLYPDYEILPFKFIVESTTAPGDPLVFNCTTDLLVLGKFGRPEYYFKGRDEIKYQKFEEIKGFVQLIELYKYYSTNGFDKDKIVRENSSELLLDWSGII